MVQVLDYQATEPLSRFNPAIGFPIPVTPFAVPLASIQINIPSSAAGNNKVELISTVGAEGISNSSQVLFRIFRNGQEIFNTQTGVEPPVVSEVNYNLTFQAIDSNLPSGVNLYQLTAENVNHALANIVGPVSFSGKAIG
jgi:hypothetical protein